MVENENDKLGGTGSLIYRIIEVGAVENTWFLA